ncbi:MAG: glucose-1-phosphate thymidylyltransferase [Actinobacteria bacterium]|nr:glucose-1-phosphate thymidylyltransferase [Actinomycetota bacterium]
MKALILSGGEGTRLRPITHTSAKQLVPVANKPILFYAIEAIKEAGIDNVGIIVGETENEIKSAIGDGSQWGIKATYIRQEAPLGLAHAVKIAEPFIKKESFVMFLGDNLIKDGIKSLVDEFIERKPNAQILLARVKDPQRFGVAELSGDKIVRLIEKPKDPPSDLALVGVYMFDKNIFEAVNNIKPSWRNELEITDAIQYMVDKGYDVQPHIINGWWKDTGKLEDMLEANRIILDTLTGRCDGFVDSDSHIIGKVVIEKGAEVINSIIRGPAIIGENTKIINSFIGPFTSVYFDVVIKNSEIEHSIILEKSSILDIHVRIEDSLIGKNVEVSKSPIKPKAYRFMLGDNSKVGVL